MVWWSYLYVAFLLYVGYESVKGSYREHGAAVTVPELLTSIAWPLLVAAFFEPSIAQRLGIVVVPAYVVALVWTAYTVWRDFRPAAAMSRLHGPGMRLSYGLILVFCAALVVPVVVLGAYVAARSLRGQ